jgi:hypothetical protein
MGHSEKFCLIGFRGTAINRSSGVALTTAETIFSPQPLAEESIEGQIKGHPLKGPLSRNKLPDIKQQTGTWQVQPKAGESLTRWHKLKKSV